MRNALLITLIATVLGFLLSGTTWASDVAGSVETGLEQLAKEIVTKSAAAEKKTIAVLPFPHADHSCSVLSTYIVDELILHLFNVKNIDLNIIERSQMEALLGELKLGTTGLLNPKTTKKLGDMSGVQALAIGTITVIGDRIRINARLVETSSARTISAAAVWIPKTQALNELLESPIESGPLCGGALGATTQGSKGNVTGSVGFNSPKLSNRKGSYSAEGLRFFVQNISRTSDSTAVNLVLGIVNENKESLPLIFVRPRASLVDNNGNVILCRQVMGMESCNYNRGDWNQDPEDCGRKNRSYFTEFTPNTLHTVALRFKVDEDDGSSNIDGKVVSLSSRVQILLDEKNKKYKNISISIPNIPLN